MSNAAQVPPLRILFRDELLVVVDKPGGMLMHSRADARGEAVLLRSLRQQLGRFLYPVHRLDRACSGVVALALDADSAADLQATLARPDAEKRYLALVRGTTAPRGSVDRPLTDRRTGRRRPARSHWRRLMLVGGQAMPMSLLEVRIDTGRRHQIRRHLASMAHQIIGDTTHGKGRINRALREGYGLPRLFLHAHHLGFAHPQESEPRVEVRALLAPDLRAFLLRLPEVDHELVASL